MADIVGELWRHNLTKIIVVDVSEDYELMQPPLPSECYPVLRETYLPSYKLSRKLPEQTLVEGFLYDWHDMVPNHDEPCFVGVVRQEMVDRFLNG